MYKKIRLRLLLLLIPVLGVSLSSHAQQATEYVSIDSLKVGDTFDYIITLNKDRLYDDVIYPDSSSFGSSFEISSRQHYKVTDFKDSLVYRLQFFGTEDVTIDRVAVKLVKEGDTTLAYTNPVPVRFKSVLESQSEEFRPYKPIFDFAAAWWPYILALLLLAGLGWYLYRYYIEHRQEEKPEPKPAFNPRPFDDPLAQLENTLTQLRSFSFDSHEDYKQFYINLGDAIRTYFESLYFIPALESTSREILYELNRRAVDEDLVARSRDVLKEADMVKFAKFTPSEEEAWKALDKGDAFLKKAKKVDQSRIDHLRRQHQNKMEQEYLAFNRGHKQKEEQSGNEGAVSTEEEETA